MAQEITAFFSYSRTDSEFVDHLDADLRARDFKTWIDRRKLEGGQDWKREIELGIERSEFFLVVLSPAAVESRYVQIEIETALGMGKQHIIPIVHKECALPPAVGSKHFIYEFLRQSYDAGLKELLYVCQNPSVGMTPSSASLYAEALALRSTDSERATVLLQHIADHDSQETVRQEAQRDLEQLNRQLYEQRAERLQIQANAARAAGTYGEEAGALEALIALGDQNPALLAWAKEYLPVAQENSKQLGLYELAQERWKAKEYPPAREKLQAVWAGTPFFRDPAGIASDLGLKTPMTYEEDKERRLANEARARNEEEATRRRADAKARLYAEAQSRISHETEQSRQLIGIVDRLTEN
jgi:hypothetical protein